MKKILYVHGLGGSGDGRVATILREHLGPDYEITAPEIPIKPKEALDFINNMLKGDPYDLVVGSSLGAFYLMASGYLPKKFLINPAAKAGEYIEKHIGKGPQKFNSERLVTRCAVSPEDELFGEENVEVCKKLYHGHVFIIHSSHRVEDDVIINDIIPKIKEFIDEDIFCAPIMIGPYFNE